MIRIEFISMSSESSRGRLRQWPARSSGGLAGRFATGVTVASVLDELGAPHGLTVSSFGGGFARRSAGADLPGPRGYVPGGVPYGKYFGINILGKISGFVGAFCAQGHDRFDGLDWLPGETGVPLLAACWRRWNARSGSG